MDSSIFQEYCVISDDAVEKSIPELVNHHRHLDAVGSDAVSKRSNQTIGSPINVPEKIIFCIDASADMEKSIFKTRVGAVYTPLNLIKRALSFFVSTKSDISKEHQFLLCPMLDEAKLPLKSEFQPGKQNFLKCLDEFTAIYTTDSCDLTGLFTQLKSLLPPTNEPVKEVLRLIIIYGRSHTLPVVDKKVLSELSKSPYFFVDVFYIHEHPKPTNQSQQIFDFFCSLDEKNTSYICEVTKNPTALYNQIAQLIAHPFQRPPQSEAVYKFSAPP